jgi:hypothetical protein
MFMDQLTAAYEFANTNPATALIVVLVIVMITMVCMKGMDAFVSSMYSAVGMGDDEGLSNWITGDVRPMWPLGGADAGSTERLSSFTDGQFGVSGQDRRYVAAPVPPAPANARADSALAKSDADLRAKFLNTY